MARGRRTRLQNVVLSVLAGSVMTLATALVLEARTAAGAGNSRLRSLIIHDPIAHGQQIPASAANAVGGAGLLEAIGILPSERGISLAASRWTYGPSSANSSLTVVLISFSIPGKSESYLAKRAKMEAQLLALTFCSYVLGPSETSPPVIQRTPGVGNYFECDRVEGLALNGETLDRGHVFALLLSTTKTFSKSSMEAIARRQYVSLQSEH